MNFALVACAWFCFSGMSPKLGSPSETQTKLLKFHMLMEEPLKNWCPPIKTPIFSQKSCPTALENSRIPSGLMSEISIVGCFLAGTVRFKGMYKLTDWIYIYIYTLFTKQNHVLSSLKTSQDFWYGFIKMAIVVDSQAY